MPVTCAFRGPVLVAETIGDYRTTELERVVAEALALPQFRRGGSILFDSRESTATLTNADIEWRVQWVTALRDNGLFARFAILAGPQAYRYGVASMLSIRLKELGVEMRAFYNESEALRWLTPE
jgi:hypothetical protein